MPADIQPTDSGSSDSVQARRSRILKGTIVRIVSSMVVVAVLVSGYNFFLATPNYSALFRLIDLIGVVREEVESEGGELRREDDRLVADPRAALSGQREIYQHLKQVVDETDLARLNLATNGGKDAPELVQRILDELGDEKQNPKTIMGSVIAQTKELQGIVKNGLRPLLFDSSPKTPEKHWETTESALVEFEASAKDLTTMLGWKSGHINADLAHDQEVLIGAILQTTKSCRDGRLAFVLLVSVDDNSDRFERLRERFVAAQKTVYAQTSELAKHRALDPEAFAEARTSLQTYAHSMQRRIQKMEHAAQNHSYATTAQQSSPPIGNVSIFQSDTLNLAN